MSRITDMSKILNNFFNETAANVSTTTGFIKRQRKLNPTSFIKTLMLGNMHNNDNSLDSNIRFLNEDLVNITRQGLHFRFTETTVSFMERMYMEALKLFQHGLRLDCSILQQFRSVKIIDSTYISLPNSMSTKYKGYGSSYPNKSISTKSGIKLQTVFDYLNQTLNTVDLKEGIRSDQGYRDHLKNITKNELLIADLGYFVPSSFKQIDEANAYFISRYKSDTNIYNVKTNEKLELLTLLKDKLFFTTDVFLGMETRLRVRMICQKLDHEQAEHRRRKANKLGVLTGNILFFRKDLKQLYNWTESA